jgi:hypothetical protein
LADEVRTGQSGAVDLADVAPSVDNVVDKILDYYEQVTLPTRLDTRTRPRSLLVRWYNVLRPSTFRNAARFASLDQKRVRSFAAFARAPSGAVAAQSVRDLDEQLLLLDVRTGGPVRDARTFRRACRELVLASSGGPANAAAVSAARLYQRLALMEEQAKADIDVHESGVRGEVERLRAAYRNEWRGWVSDQESQTD